MSLNFILKVPGYYYIKAVHVFFSEPMSKVAYLRIHFSPYISFIMFHNHLSLVITNVIKLHLCNLIDMIYHYYLYILYD